MSSEVDPKALEAAAAALHRMYRGNSLDEPFGLMAKAAIQAYLSASPSIGRVGALEQAARAGWEKGRRSWCPAKVLEDQERTERDWAVARPSILSTLVSHEEPAGDTQGALPVVDETRPTYQALNRLVSGLPSSDYDGVEQSAVDVALQWSKFFEAAGAPCPLVWWHGGDAIVFNFGDWMLTMTDGGVGLLDPSNRRTMSAALVSPPDNGEVVEALIEACNQIEYLHGRFQETGSGNAVIAKLTDLRRKLQSPPPALQSHNEGSE